MEANADGAVLYEEHPRMFRGHPFGFVLSILLIPVAGIGILILLAWWLRCKQTLVRLDASHTLVEEGLFSKSRIELRHSHVRTVHVYQTFGQRIFGVGKVEIYTSGDDPEITVNGMSDPHRIREIISGHGA